MAGPLAPVLVSLGSNIDPEVNLPRALALLGERVRVVAVSQMFRTAPAAGRRGRRFSTRRRGSRRTWRRRR